MSHELYEDDLVTLTAVMHSLEDVSRIDGVFEVEIRVRVDDVRTWAVIGWGEAGDPCILRFEEDPPPTPVKLLPGQGGFIFTNPAQTLYRSPTNHDESL